jgi:hypothetical protein
MMKNALNDFDNIKIFLYKIENIKELINCILENGAYSNSNYNRQMSKKSHNYTEFEGKLVTLGFRFKKCYGEKMQKALFGMITEDKEFLEYLKINDQALYYMVEEMCKIDTRL